MRRAIRAERTLLVEIIVVMAKVNLAEYADFAARSADNLPRQQPIYGKPWSISTDRNQSTGRLNQWSRVKVTSASHFPSSWTNEDLDPMVARRCQYRCRTWLRGSCSRQRVACALVSLFVIQAMLAIAVEWWPSVRDPEFAVREAILTDHVRKSPDVPLLLMLGSSRTQFALQAGRLSRQAIGGKAIVFNFGMPASGPLMQLVCLRRLLDKGLRPDRLFVEVTPPMLSWQRGVPTEERMLDGSRLSADEVARLCPYYEQPWRLLWKWGLGRCLPVNSRRAALRRAVSFDRYEQGTDPYAPGQGMDDHGWQPRIPRVDPEDHKRWTKLARDQYGGALANFEVSPHARQAMLELLALCRSDGIDVTLVLMPEGTAFRALYPPEADEALERFLAELCRDQQVALLDARRWVDDAEFSDGHHVLPGGAAIFSDRFQAEVLGPVLASLPRGKGERKR